MYMEKGKKIPKISWEEYNKISENINDDEELKKKYQDYIETNGDEKYYTWKSLYKEVGYWRKANAIHKWFVDNVQDGVDNCEKYLLTKEKLQGLYDICEELMNTLELIDGKVFNGQRYTEHGWVNEYIDGKVIKDITKAQELLPTQSGFFFGDTEYDEWYYNQVKYTYELLKDILENFDFENNYLIYQSSW